MKLPGNISYLLRSKENEKLPDIFNEFILDSMFQMSSYIDCCEYRLNMLADNTVLNVKDFGTGNSGMRKVKDIARRSSTDVRYGGVIQKIIDAFKVKSILELGTSVGIGTMFLARTNAKAKVTTIEGCPETYEFAKSEFVKRKIANVNFINDDFDHLFACNALKDKHFDLAFIDGNHTSEATIRYFDIITKRYSNKKSIIIIDDINWSHDMYSAWKEISSRVPDSLRINLFRMGIIFSGYVMPKEEVIAEIFKWNE
ncbi:MAG: class I SAM-dependent methyltransferase [Bacteroidales bacterium]|nr:class I SAM-dependent methyltransferase [Bacteroidales bacterium]